MNLRRLKYFVKIVEIGSLTQAAEILHIAQPALSQQLATLEGELKQQLLIRTKRGVTPTEAGNILYAHAQTILRQCEQAQNAVTGVGQALSGQVSVGLTPGSAASQLALPLLQAVREQHPGILLYLDENIGSALGEAIVSGRVDMAMLYGNKPANGLCYTPLLKEDLYLVGTLAVPNPGVSVELSEVAKLNLFLPRSHHVMRKLVDDALALRRLQATVIGEIESVPTLTAAVASGLGATILPESAARALAGPARAWVSRINCPALQVPLSLCLSDSLPLSAAAAAVKEILLSLMSESPSATRMAAVA
ncbi:nitrogen assimilation transcriptional regulator [Chimaeribacter arupi]|uniref:nitrogen assimilation transcriptional regulator NAC n=1 Tax=Chimaeribacter arupi TaxID=2060066 RepID=UPI000C7C1942|nr:nitrogen assimilation transcriptional regulator NAC [Chimaeribacter arupi]PLR41894.1 nitrogen assimilation transcriptional regulator [Chimaeribacter arupi]PLR42172.1 nitrogen assimilation transcriptional regulator [Chimaeribacter arupi]